MEVGSVLRARENNWNTFAKQAAKPSKPRIFGTQVAAGGRLRPVPTSRLGGSARWLASQTWIVRLYNDVGKATWIMSIDRARICRDIRVRRKGA
jgi:hypothetical protein